MQAWLDFLPLVIFFVAYKVAGIFVAAGALIIATAIVFGAIWFKNRRLETSQWLVVISTFVLSGLTLILHNEQFLQWKAPAIYVLLALLFLGSQFVGDKPLIKRAMEQTVELSPAQWRGLNLCWVVFFLLAASANAGVVLYYPAYWVDFKLFGSMAMTFGFILAQGVWLIRKGAIKDTESDTTGTL